MDLMTWAQGNTSETCLKEQLGCPWGHGALHGTTQFPWLFQLCKEQEGFPELCDASTSCWTLETLRFAAGDPKL